LRLAKVVVELSEKFPPIFGDILEEQLQLRLVSLDLFGVHLVGELLVQEVVELGQKPQQVDGSEGLRRQSPDLLRKFSKLDKK